MWCNQIFSLINEQTVQNIVVCDNYEIANQISRIQYGDDSYAVDTTHYPLAIGCFHIDGLFYEPDGKTLIERNLTADEEANLARIKVEQLEKQINPNIDIKTCTLKELKEWKVKQSKEKLENYLKEHILESSCHGSTVKAYTITKEKQSLLSQMIIIAQTAKQEDIQFQPSWNAAGEICTYDWTLEELQQLAVEIENFIRPLVQLQQTTEEAINKSINKEEVMKVNIDYPQNRL
ncbi:hypothetical protein acsn021_01700 [Anaerocolumna cellulosilytica]|uniref:Uncharacterized protein n=1 Tax=Anaerocolumna cellulosilytica TaxID=433286 RepID=A0A6S6R033_9FIRM|nr:hypothetical protein [Anaerocolumna cellulosilytica]MBB5197926.1 hypothetical protein [Anaerocolumna cellulosilytica]BCJ92601.1 hypothetical protein acsn021_01700 [Anaerocolumna cellulosilytica]